MRLACHAILTLGILLTTSLPMRADDAAAARALVNKAIEAQGGEAKLAKFGGYSAKLKGTFHGMGQALAINGELATQGPDKLKFAMEAEIMGQKFEIAQVLSGDKGWLKVNNDVNELGKDELAETKEEAYSDWLSTLLPLKGKTITLSTVGESTVDKRKALGILVSSKGHRDINLYFDKETGLLVKAETRVKVDGQEVAQETFVSDYKEVQGVKQALRFVIKRDGKPFMEGELSELQLAEKLDDKVFAKP